jgi:integrase/recombinase XerC
MSHRGPQKDELLKGFAEHLTMERNRSPLTVDAYMRDLREYRAHVGGDKRLATATLSDIRQYLMYLAGERRVDARTIRRRLSALRTFYKYMKLMGLRDDNPAADVPGPALPDKDPEHLNVTEVSKLLRTSIAGRSELQRLRDRAIMELLYATGIRRAEVATIDLHGLDLAARTIEVMGKGRKRRTIPMNHAAARAIEAYLGVRPRTTSQALFVGRHGGRLTPKHIWRIFRDIYDVSGLQKHAGPHTIRHSFATHMVENDADLETVREFLGHKHLSTTGIYLKLAMEHKRRQYDEAHPRDRMDDAEPDGRRRRRR